MSRPRTAAMIRHRPLRRSIEGWRNLWSNRPQRNKTRVTLSGADLCCRGFSHLFSPRDVGGNLAAPINAGLGPRPAVDRSFPKVYMRRRRRTFVARCLRTCLLFYCEVCGRLRCVQQSPVRTEYARTGGDSAMSPHELVYSCFSHLLGSVWLCSRAVFARLHPCFLGGSRLLAAGLLARLVGDAGYRLPACFLCHTSCRIAGTT